MTEQNIKLLCQEVERVCGRSIKTASDFDFLSAQIYEKTHEHVSSSTLMRLFGYRSDGGSVRKSTLDILAHYVGCADSVEWEKTVTCPQVLPQEGEQNFQGERKRNKSKKIILLILLALIVVAGAAVFLFGNKGTKAESEPVLLKSISELRNDRQYLIHTRGKKRGSLGVDSPELATTCPQSLFHHCDTASAFAIINYEGSYFLYSTVSKRFFSFNTFETDDPMFHNCGAIDIIMEQGHFVFNFWYDRSLNRVATLNVNWKIGVVITSWGTYNNVYDNGNLFAIEDAGPFDPTEALEKLRLSAEKHKDDVYRPDSAIWKQIEMSDAPLPMGRRRPPIDI